VAPRDAIVIVDEPEAHVHKAILLPLWDAIEKARVDCGFVYITHDSDFACARSSAAQYFIGSYQHPDAWDIEVVPLDIGLPEHIVTELVGSRKPILFVEGERGSIDTTLYRHQYPGFTVVPVGSCESVIHAVASYNSSSQLHRIRARGLVDADGRSPEDIAHLETLGVHVLPVAEVENVLLLPNVFLALAQALACATPTDRLTNLISRVVAEANRNIDGACTRHAIRQLDTRLKRIGVNAKDLTSLQSCYEQELATVDPRGLCDNHKALLQRSIADSDLPKILAFYDNKGLLAQAATCLGIMGPKELIEKTWRLLGTELGAKIGEALNAVLPTIPLQ
jgi:hypothetical protein